MAEILFKGRKIDELKVVEIKDELGQRGLSKKGVKSVLIKRLEKALMQERLDQVSLKCIPRLYIYIPFCKSIGDYLSTLQVKL